MYYSITHRTRFRYSAPISESITEIQMQPRTEYGQRCLQFNLKMTPRAHLNQYTDPLGNTVHYFDIPARHSQLIILAESIVESQPQPPLPESLSPAAWEEIDAAAHIGDHIELLLPGRLSNPSSLLRAFAASIGAHRRDDPLTLLRQINAAIYEAFDYVPTSTDVDSHIDDALTDHKGVCQDFAHIMLAIGRELGIPCRYISGYLFHRYGSNGGRSAPDATHAWIEALLPGLGWVGFDPTNNMLTDERHIRVAIGREYGDVPPTRGVFKGTAETRLSVEVDVKLLDHLPLLDTMLPGDSPTWSNTAIPYSTGDEVVDSPAQQ